MKITKKIRRVASAIIAAAFLLPALWTTLRKEEGATLAELLKERKL